MDPIIPFSSSGLSVVSWDNNTYSSTLYFGYKGDIKATVFRTTTPDGNYPRVNEKMTLADGIPSMNIVDVQKTSALQYKCENYEFKQITSINYSSGEHTYNTTTNDQNINCSGGYESPLPITVTDHISISRLLLHYEAGINQLVDSNCPYDDNVPDDTSGNCTVNRVTNWIITDENGDVHKIAHKIDSLHSHKNLDADSF